MGIKLSDELAREMFNGDFEKDLKQNPEKNDFYYYPTYGGEKFQVRFSKDLNVTGREWHIIVTNINENNI